MTPRERLAEMVGEENVSKWIEMVQEGLKEEELVEETV